MNALKLSNELSLPLDFASRTIAIVGIRGAGKTNTASVIIEELLELNLPAVIIDPTDAWWGLRTKYPVFIFGGSHGDMPLSENDGKTVAQFIVSESVPAILSMRHMRKGAQRRFVTDFCEEIYHLKGEDKYRTSLTVVIDECPLFIPQKVMGENARTVGAVEDLIARGRSSGFGVVLIGQRPATINKDVLTQSDAIIAHRVTSPQDRKALGEWFEVNATSDKQREILNSLSTLQAGKAWVWAPTLDTMQLTQVRRRKTFDSSATPKVGEVIASPKNLTQINLDVLRGKMADALKQAKENDPAELKRRIKDLESKGQERRVETQTPVIQTKIVERPLMADGDRHEMNEVQQVLRDMQAKLESIYSNMTSRMKICEDSIFVRRPTTGLPTAPIGSRIPARELIVGRVQNDPSPGKPSDVKLSKVEKKFLSVLVQRESKRTTRNQLAIFTGYSSKSSHVDNTISKLRTGGFVEGSADSLNITDAGVSALGSEYERLPQGRALINYWIAEVGKAPGAMLGILVNCYPTALTRDEVARIAGYSVESSHVDNSLSMLRTMELIDGDRKNLQAHANLFQ